MTNLGARLGTLVVTALLVGGAASGCGSGNDTDEGTVAIAHFTVQVTAESSFNPGGTSRYAIKINVGQQVDTVQAWFGSEADTTRVTGTFDSGDGAYDVDVPIPAEVPSGARLWVSITQGGQTFDVSFAVTH